MTEERRGRRLGGNVGKVLLGVIIDDIIALWACDDCAPLDGRSEARASDEATRGRSARLAVMWSLMHKGALGHDLDLRTNRDQVVSWRMTVQSRREEGGARFNLADAG